uniref:Ubiquinone biosynthesis protein UbiV n=1 Tax=Candidatus Kentrum sp. MB TaxID=2138164 RepID=A0A450XXW2_9GAMM|nr:MAG: Collagenase-like protease, PrtC family [Candidatus Kentron sp. MB]VFK34077.1 MAG: Collagenase-like protease, PrtC family [Candidatus Kentron sp. MB]VFK76575.1 MAG: Collagenase-like protease, PrtC family [Candidatus Kentron sp. MB]
MKLSLAPIPYFWSADTIRGFYQAAAQWPVDVIYLGETVCGKRRSLSFEDWMEIGEELTESGKEVALSSLALLEAESELATLARICANDRFPVEANDMGAVHLLQNLLQKRQTDVDMPTRGFIVGPHINTYNTGTLSLLTELGAMRWVAPVELSRATLRDLQGTRPDGLQTEVQVYGHLPLAFSARCFTARAHNLPKDQCDFCCGNYPEGLALKTQEDSNLFTINGVQIQSAGPCNLLMATEELSELGVELLRIVPQSQGTEAVIRAFRDVADGNIAASAAMDRLPASGPGGWCNGFWLDEAGMVWEEEMSQEGLAKSGIEPTKHDSRI